MSTRGVVKPSSPISLRKEIDRVLLRKSLLTSQIRDESKTLKAAKQQLLDTQTAHAYLQQLAQEIQSQAHKQISKVVSRCLSAVFDSPYELKIEFVRKRGRTEARFVYIRDGYEINPRVTSGGVLEVASLALRLASLVLTMPPARKLLVLDEPVLGLSKENKQKIGVLLSTLSTELGVQVLLATHDPELQIGKVIQL